MLLFCFLFLFSIRNINQYKRIPIFQGKGYLMNSSLYYMYIRVRSNTIVILLNNWNQGTWNRFFGSWSIITFFPANTIVLCRVLRVKIIKFVSNLCRLFCTISLKSLGNLWQIFSNSCSWVLKLKLWLYDAFIPENPL
jgi:hypothetical protein